jgi:hypothetical protein
MEETSIRPRRARGLLIPLDDHEALIALRDFDRKLAAGPSSDGSVQDTPGGAPAADAA